MRLFGYSGGAQFAMRHHARLAGGASCSCGAGLVYDAGQDQPFPYGLPDTPRWRAGQSILTGCFPFQSCSPSGRTIRGATRHSIATSLVDSLQGQTRLERAHRWEAAMAAAAGARGLPANLRLKLLPGAGHDFNDNMLTHGLGEIAVDGCPLVE